MSYAAGTEVSPGKSRDDIERVLTRYGADGFAYGVQQGRAVLAFTAGNRHVRFVLPMPFAGDDAIRLTPTRQVRSKTAQQTELEKETRRRWRALHLVIKAKLEAVETGIVTFDQEFAMHMVLPDGSTVAEQVLPAISEAYATGVCPPLLPGTPSRPALGS